VFMALNLPSSIAIKGVSTPATLQERGIFTAGIFRCDIWHTPRRKSSMGRSLRFLGKFDSPLRISLCLPLIGSMANY
jgi:hypothetical protein